MRLLFAICFLLAVQPATAQANYFIRFPNHLHFADCAGIYAPPVLYNPDSLHLTVDYEDQIFGITPACYTITRMWSVKGPDYTPDMPCVYVPNPHPNPIIYAPENLLGVTISAPGNSVPGWEPTSAKINPLDPTPVDFSVFYTGGSYTTLNNGLPISVTVAPLSLTSCLYYYQRIDVIDSVKPIILNCPATPPIFADSTWNDTLLWHAGYWYNPASQTEDLGEAPVQLILTGEDDCTDINVNAQYFLFLDLDQDGTAETVINSSNPPPPGQVYFNNINTPNYSGGTLREFDHRPVPTNQKYRFGMQGLSDGKRQIAWHTQQSFPDWTIPQLPTGNHRIQWIVVDGCGNESAPCEYSFTVMANNTVTTQEENPKNLAVWIYPNPAGGNDQLHLEYPGLMNGQFDLYDGRGRRVLSRSISGNQVVLAKPDLPAGLYYFQVRQNGKMRGSGKLSIL